VSATVSCLVCETPAAQDDRFCGACGALLPDRPAARSTANELDLERLFVHQGRIGRLEFLLTAVVLNFFLLMALGLLVGLSENILGILLGLVLTGAAGFALACASIKRMRDTNMPSWLAVAMAFIAVIPMIGWMFGFMFAIIGPDNRQNPHGAPGSGSVRPRRV
jgi:uncharacterized membrane protein YhaH (DUF805 family)